MAPPKGILSMIFPFLMTFLRANSTLVSTERLPIQNQLYSIRLANFQDIPAINRCNVENLPENYDYEFYSRHLTLFPELSLIAENTKRELIGYTLGKAEELLPSAPSVPLIDRKMQVLPNAGFKPTQNNKKFEPRFCGHVTSLAVFKEYRQLGVGRELMAKLHEEMARHYSIDTVNLHCRVSNIPAIRLYSDVFDYQCSSLVRSYYDDDEDAWVMTREGILDAFKSKNKVISK